MKWPTRKELYFMLFLAAITLAVYTQVYGFNFLNLHDPEYMLQNQAVTKNLSQAGTLNDFTYWQPLTILSHKADYLIFGTRAGGHHLVNLVLHLANTLLLFWIFSQITGSAWRSAIVAALFAIHPVNAETVCWITQRKTLLSCFFFLATISAYARYAQKPGAVRFIPVFLAMCCAIMSKPVAVTLPFMLLALDYWPLGRMSLDKKYLPKTIKNAPVFQKNSISFLIKEKIPLFAVAGAGVFLTMASGMQLGLNEADAMPIFLAVKNAIFSYFEYLQMLVWPQNLMFFYPFPESFTNSLAIKTIFIFLLITSIAARQIKTNPALAVGWFWFMGNLAPVFGLIRTGAWPAMADHFVYIPAIGIFVAAAWSYPDTQKAQPQKRAILTIAIMLIIFIFAAASHTQAKIWKNSYLLHGRTLRFYYNPINLNLLADWLYENQWQDNAIRFYQKALEFNRDYLLARMSLGNALAEKGELKKAVKHYKKAIKTNPNHAPAYSQLAGALAKQGKTELSIKYYKTSISINPGLETTRVNLASALTATGRFDQALAQYKKALQINPDFAEAYTGLGITLARMGRYKEAIRVFEKNLKSVSDEAQTLFYIGDAYLKWGNHEQAATHFYMAIAANPDFAMAYNSLGKTMMMMGNSQAAARHFKKALEINPDCEDAKKNLEYGSRLKAKIPD